MKRNYWIKISRVILYPNRLVSALFAVAASYLIVSNDFKHYNMRIAFADAFFINALLIYLLVIINYGLTKFLNRICPWEKNFKQRGLRQLMLGIFIPLILPVIMAFGYFSRHGINILRVKYFEYYVLEMFAVLAVLNLFALLQWKIKTFHPHGKDSLTEIMLGEQKLTKTKESQI